MSAPTRRPSYFIQDFRRVSDMPINCRHMGKVSGKLAAQRDRRAGAALLVDYARPIDTRSGRRAGHLCVCVVFFSESEVDVFEQNHRWSMSSYPQRFLCGFASIRILVSVPIEQHPSPSMAIAFGRYLLGRPWCSPSNDVNEVGPLSDQGQRKRRKAVSPRRGKAGSFRFLLDLAISCMSS